MDMRTSLRSGAPPGRAARGRGEGPRDAGILSLCTVLGVAGSQATAAKPPELPLEDLARHLDGVLKTGLNTITADDVAKLLLDADPANDPFVLDVRNRPDFLRGHVPGAVNVPLSKLPAAWQRNPALVPDDRNVVVVSYYGGDGNMASLVINAVRIEDPAAFATYPWSKAMFMGMMSWSFDPALCNGHRYDSDLGAMRVDLPTETTPRTAETHDLPRWRPIRTTSMRTALLKRAAIALRRVKDPCDLQVPAPDLVAALGTTKATAVVPQVLSVRGGPDYAKGHIPGAINIGYKDVALLEKRQQIDPARPVVAYCYTGHTGSLAAMALRLLGYDVRNLLYGMNGWSPSTAVASGQLTKFDLNRGWDFPVDDGGADDLGSMAAYVPETGCVECHTSLTSIFYDRTVANPPPAPPAPPSIGEG